MTQSIHGHKVMQKMIDSGKVHSKESLRTSVAEWFGETARFHTCSTENMTIDELTAFLAERSKFMAEEGGFRVNEDEICDDA